MLTIDCKKIDETLFSFAAKSDPENKSNWLPLCFHLVDTAIVMEFLQNNWISSVYEEHGCSVEQLKKVGIFVAAVHDIGKLMPSFQQMIAPNIMGYEELLAEQGIVFSECFSEDERKKYGHHAEGGALLLHHYGVCREVAVVIAAHHGSIPGIGYTDEDSSKLAMHRNLFYDSKNENEWDRLYRACMDFALEVAGFNSIRDIPVIDKESQLLMSGLLITADWIASNKEYFPLLSNQVINQNIFKVYPDRGIEGISKLNFPQKWEITKRWKEKDLVQASFGFCSNEMQRKVQQIAGSIEKPGLLIIEAPMGNGKTEAGLSAAEIFGAKMRKSGLAFFLPSQATSNALFSRLENWARCQTNGNKLALQLAHGSFLLNNDFQLLQRDSNEQSGNPDIYVHQFFCGSKAFLLANFVVGTIDQLLMAAVQQKHVMIKHLGLADKVVIIDECHAYDAYMNTYLDRILNFLFRYRVPVILLSATLPVRRRLELLRAYSNNNLETNDNNPLTSRMEYPMLSWTDGETIESDFINLDRHGGKKIQIENISEEEVIHQIKNDSEAGACIGVIVNTVAKAQRLAKEVMKFAGDRTVLYHAQYLFPDRIQKEKEILDRVGKRSGPQERKGCIIIGTQVLEQSLDIDFDVLITDICPMDLLLQRIGRLHRHTRSRPSEYERAVCYVIGLNESTIDEGSQAIYGYYLLQKTRMILPSYIMIPKDISSLVQTTYDECNISRELDLYFQEYKFKRNDQERRAHGYLLEPLVYGRRLPKTIEGLSRNGVSEDSARASVRDGDPSLEVILLYEEENGELKLLSKENSHVSISVNQGADTRLSKLLAGEKLRLPYILSNKRNAPRIIEYLHGDNNVRLHRLQNSPWLKDELFLILDRNKNATLPDNYLIQYSQEYGLVVTGGEKNE